MLVVSNNIPSQPPIGWLAFISALSPSHLSSPIASPTPTSSPLPFFFFFPLDLLSLPSVPHASLSRITRTRLEANRNFRTKGLSISLFPCFALPLCLSRTQTHFCLPLYLCPAFCSARMRNGTVFEVKKLAPPPNIRPLKSLGLLLSFMVMTVFYSRCSFIEWPSSLYTSPCFYGPTYSLHLPPQATLSICRARSPTSFPPVPETASFLI
jgi:hypothetical protein